MSLSLDKRLNMAASLVREYRFTVDVGTDHAYLPAFLVLSGKTESVIACDVAVGPLENAASTVSKYELENNIRLCLSDGLKGIPEFYDGEIVICGMGGNLISNILDDAHWICSRGIHLVLQPMSHCEDVRQWLCSHGFEIDSESAVRDGRHIYICISAFYTGEKKEYNPGYFYFGKLPKNPVPEAAEYIEATKCRLRKRLDALEKAGQATAQTEYLRRVTEYGDSL